MKTAQEQESIFYGLLPSGVVHVRDWHKTYSRNRKSGVLNSNFVCCKYDMERRGIMLYKKYKDNIPDSDDVSDQSCR
ncbi:MAG: hypothetical protein ACLU4N_15005 [Butyricimonas faecihominis]